MYIAFHSLKCCSKVVICIYVCVCVCVPSFRTLPCNRPDVQGEGGQQTSDNPGQTGEAGGRNILILAGRPLWMSPKGFTTDEQMITIK